MSKINKPKLRKDLEFIPIQHEGRQLVYVRDHLGLVKEGQAVPFALYQVMIALDGTRDLRDLQMEMMRQRNGVLVSTEEIKGLIDDLEGSFLLESDRFNSARDQIVSAFISSKIRPCTHGGLSYPNHPGELHNTLNDILAKEPPGSKPNGKITALIAPHIDIVVGAKAYAAAYRMLEHAKPSRVIILGTGHKMMDRLFSITGKDFETPVGILKTDQDAVECLRRRGKGVISKDDFEHRTEHAIEFQTIFMQHLLQEGSYEIVPILCGPVQPSLPEYGRKAFKARTDSFCQGLAEILAETGRETIIIAGVDFSHIGPKFGHDMPATHLQVPAEAHDKKLIHCLTQLDADGFWEESRAVQDRYNVCGFSAMACLLEVLPPGRGMLQHYHLWHEEATRSAVSFAAMTFTTME